MKGRLLFEGPFKNWDFYFVSARDTNSGIGAQDLEFMIERMSTTQGWVDNIFKHHAAEGIADANVEIPAFQGLEIALTMRPHFPRVPILLLCIVVKRGVGTRP